MRFHWEPTSTASARKKNRDRMTTYILRRILLFIPLFLGISFINFLLIDFMPGDALTAMSLEAPLRSDESLAIKRAQLGLDAPLPVRYVVWLKGVLKGNLGVSLVNRWVIRDVMAERLLATLELMGVSLLLSIIIGVLLGFVSAVKTHSPVEYALTFFGMIGYSVPIFFLGLLLIYAFSLKLGWFPTSGMNTVGVTSIWDNLHHLVLPCLALTVLRVAVFMRYTRNSLLEVFSQDYLITARAKGLSERVVLFRHAFRNALIPLLTVIGLSLPTLVAGAVFIETVFQWPGIGLMFITAVQQRDFPVVMAVTLMICVVVLISNLVTDIAYGIADPRIRYS